MRIASRSIPAAGIQFGGRVIPDLSFLREAKANTLEFETSLLTTEQFAELRALSITIAFEGPHEKVVE
jgi:hypothetical protein